MKKVICLGALALMMGCNETVVQEQPTQEVETTKSPAIVSTEVNADTKVATYYELHFDNAVHHEVQVEVTFTGLKATEAEFRMSRTSPGRYALHEFMKNVYDVKVTDEAGNVLKATRPDPYAWKVKGHKGTLKVSYTVFANRGGGTYAQIDETHAHLNMPAIFMYAPELAEEAAEIRFHTRDDLQWKVATQLPKKGTDTYYAKNLQYLMDSPTEISNHSVRSFEVDGQNIHFVLHHNGTASELDTYFEKVKKIVKEQKAVYGELPEFDYGNYYFLACYIPNASGDGMEHRNSTILTTTRSLAEGGMERNIGTVSHEFFHAWNVERIRPQSLEPFDFEAANMSGELWFAEGFTSYYTTLMMCRAGLLSQEAYISGLTGTFNYVWNSPGRQFFNPIEMSYQAPFVDAAKSVDPVNRNNTFISYYSYGSALGLALDLSLREKNLNLDAYMKRVWEQFGKHEKAYTVADLHKTLNDYAGAEFGDDFFENYIYKSEMPNMKRLFEMVGVQLEQDAQKVTMGVSIKEGRLTSNALMGLSAYNAGLDKGDVILEVDQKKVPEDMSELLSAYKPGDKVSVKYLRFGEERETELTFEQDPAYTILMNTEVEETQKMARNQWLSSQQ